MSRQSAFAGLQSRLALPLLLGLLGCGSAEPKSSDERASSSDSYFPLVSGNSWAYVVIDQESDETSSKTQRVEGREPVPGREEIVAYRLTTEKAGAISTVSWQDERDLELVRFLEHSLDFDGSVRAIESYDPYKLRLDQKPEHLNVGATFSQEYAETHTNVVEQTTSELAKHEEWLVEAVDEMVTVPAGTFECLRLRRSGDATQPIKTFFFARGVGKIKETGGQTEELASYELDGS
jgi:hypothetical protein